ncbi:MAG TPA: glycosyltransferase family 39 protein [Chthoniobacterales bacterium]|nr:glycosyltransferase family 39 protein [Chthoniobacterales bacterium]
MPGAADFVQRAVHAMEAGGLAVWIRRGLVVVVLFAVAGYYMWNFRGLATSQAMDQAQIGREIASGHGWSTNFARPLAVGQLEAHGRNVKTDIWIDTYNAPLPPLVNAIALLMVKSRWQMGASDLVYAGDKAIATMSILFFLGSVGLLFLIARRLFDQRIAIFACALVLLCDMLWQYSLTGLPQMLLLLLFSASLYCLVRAVEAKYAGAPVTRWLAAVGLGFGLLGLTHALTIWIFLALLIVSVLFFAPRGWAAAIMLGAFAVVYVPWLIRTWMVCGNPAGIAFYSLFDGVGKSETAWMRQLSFDWTNLSIGAFRNKLSNNLVNHMARIFQLLGWNVVAMAFFPALLHRFKRPETSSIRWIVLAMWGGALFGMCLYGMTEEQGFTPNQLHLLFIPIMVCYGLAFLLVMWNRLEVNIPFGRLAFIALLFLLCAFPMVNTMLLSGRKPQVIYPPYVPPYVAILRSWMQPNEITASDMPWAIAWYAGRRSVWLPDKVKTFTELSDYQKLGGPIPAIYLTPISGSSNKWGDIIHGEYKDWAGIIQRTASLEKFPLRYATLALGVNEEALFLSDTDRTKTKPK